MSTHYLSLLASVYRDDSYSADKATAANSGGLADTGIAIIVIATLTCLVIFVALILRHIGKGKQGGKNKKYTARKRR